jgi:hypothetical protein
MPQEEQVFTTCLSSITISDVTCDLNCGTPQLVRESKSLGIRETGGQPYTPLLAEFPSAKL